MGRVGALAEKFSGLTILSLYANVRGFAIGVAWPIG
jgi:hypothetical protein